MAVESVSQLLLKWLLNFCQVQSQASKKLRVLELLSK